MKTPLIIAFGSRIAGMVRSDSDYDFGIFTGKDLSLDDRSNYSEYVSEKLGINEDKIDIVDLYTASPILKFEVAKKGKLIEGDEYDFFRFKVGAFREYNDTAKFRKMREKKMLEKYL